MLSQTHCQNFNDANDVVYKTFAVKCFFRGKLQHAALVCVTKAFKIYKKKKKWENNGKRDGHKGRQNDDNN